MARLSDLARPGALAGDIVGALVVTVATFAIAGRVFGLVTLVVATGWLLVIHLPDREDRSDQGRPPSRTMDGPSPGEATSG